MFINKVFLYGNLTRDLELRSLPNSGFVTNMSIATNRTWRDKEGTKHEAPEYHDIVIFGKQAELVTQYLSKGSSVFVEGRLQTRSWDQNGIKRYKTEVVADNIQFGPKKAESSGYSNEQNKKQESNPPEINPDDIPF